MSRHSTFRIGGTAKRFLLPRTAEELAEALAANPGAAVIGGGSNILFSDAGLNTVICLKEMNGVEERETDEGYEIKAMAGASFSALASRAHKLGVTGLEFASGIPGSVGGAVVMNAGAWSGEVKDVLKEAEVSADSVNSTLPPAALGLHYRKSSLPEGAVVVSATFALPRGDREEIKKKMKENKQRRQTGQPLEYPSAGSVFKNPEGDFAGRLIEAAGLKGLRQGDAQVSEKHANFIVNLGKATAKDVYELMRRVERDVLERCGVALEREIKLIGEF